MYWNTDYAHDLGILSLEEVGTFKDIALYPTFLLSEAETFYQIGHGRPSGLMPANNLLSVIVLFTLVFNLYLRNTAALNVGDLVANLVAVLIMSKLVFVLLSIIYLIAMFGRNRMIRMAGLKNGCVFVVFLWLYSLCFPGLFSVNVSINAMTWSLGFRVIDILVASGFGELSSLFWFSSSEYGLDLSRDGSVGSGYTSGFSQILGSVFFVPLILCIAVGLIKFRAAVLTMRDRGTSQVQFYYVFMMVIILSYAVIPVLLQSILFAFIMGLIFQPIFGRSGKG